MKITAIIGTVSKKHTYKACEDFLNLMKAYENTEVEIIRLYEYNLQICKGCKICLDKGEEKCPLKDDRDVLLEKMMHSDGILFASPNYSFHVTGLMKIFLDRFGYIFHRPQFFGKTFTCIVTEGVYGGKKILKYFDFIANALGFNVVKGVCLKTRMPVPEKVKIKNELALKKLSKKFYTRLIKEKYPKPNLIELMMFRMARSGIKRELNESYRDYVHYKKKGWFNSDFFYPVSLNPVMKLSGKLFDRLKM